MRSFCSFYFGAAMWGLDYIKTPKTFDHVPTSYANLCSNICEEIFDDSSVHSYLLRGKTLEKLLKAIKTGRKSLSKKRIVKIIDKKIRLEGAGGNRLKYNAIV